MIRVLSLGAGVQSSALVLMASAGIIGPMPDVAVFSDTGDERRETYRHVEYLHSKMTFPLVVVRRSEMSLSESTIAHYREEGGFDQTPPFFHPGGMLAKHCSKEWKTRVVVKYVREHFMGLGPGERGPSEKSVEMWMGISRDEIVRMKPNEVPWIENRFPLIDRNMRRGDCVKWLVENGHPVPVRSACVYCPYRSGEEMQEMKNRQNVDDDWKRATDFDDAIRNGGAGTYGPLYVSRTLKPLREVEFDRQPSLFENECEGGCGL